MPTEGKILGRHYADLSVIILITACCWEFSIKNPPQWSWLVELQHLCPEPVCQPPVVIFISVTETSCVVQRELQSRKRQHQLLQSITSAWECHCASDCCWINESLGLVPHSASQIIWLTESFSNTKLLSAIQHWGDGVSIRWKRTKQISIDAHCEYAIRGNIQVQSPEDVFTRIMSYKARPTLI